MEIHISRACCIVALRSMKMSQAKLDILKKTYYHTKFRDPSPTLRDHIVSHITEICKAVMLVLVMAGN